MAGQRERGERSDDDRQGEEMRTATVRRSHPAAAHLENETSIRVQRAGAKRFAILSKLGAGGMADVFEVFDPETERVVALKRLRDDDPRLRRLFEREARITARLEHPNVIPLYERGETDDQRPYFTMRRMRGPSFASYLRDARDGEVSNEALVAFLGVCQAVAYAHAEGVVHRDLKPANVMWGAFGEVRVMDWGVAAELGRDDRELDGAVIGTPGHASPQQILGQPASVQDDVYALGVMLWQLLRRRSALELTGRGAFDGLELPLAELVQACVAYDPAERLGSVQELAQHVQREIESRERVVVLRRRVRPGLEIEFEIVLARIHERARSHEGLRSVTVVRPSEHSPDYVIVGRFADGKSVERWLADPVRRAAILEAGELCIDGGELVVERGLVVTLDFEHAQPICLE